MHILWKRLTAPASGTRASHRPALPLKTWIALLSTVRRVANTSSLSLESRYLTLEPYWPCSNAVIRSEIEHDLSLWASASRTILV